MLTSIRPVGLPTIHPKEPGKMRCSRKGVHPVTITLQEYIFNERFIFPI